VNELMTGFLYVIGGLMAIGVGIFGLLFLLYVLGKASNKRRPR
jgi:hypothetical protein